MKCEHPKCTRKATQSNNQYFKGKWYCTYHANRIVREGKRKRKYGDRGGILGCTRRS